ncbi:permease [Maledivibacter halophilus]|uniref:Predicted permeases n=1 Tax=Maledivibacter halophilus TaxID=36842 RepID=A0A1T5MJ01_9FIRM|nr:permease [Maledivibacter halophilus]SKC88043.1 Predicted permeases [Maledivibacter halophilus]
MKNKRIEIIGLLLYILFIFASFIFKFEPGVKIGMNFISFTMSMLKVLPCAFILIGLFEVWVKKETIEKYFGKASGYKGYLWAVILSSTTVGGAYVAFPVGYSLYKKGAALSYVLTYIGASSLARIPMTIFEASFIGIKFSIIRLVVSLPLVILSSIIISKYLPNEFSKE